MVYISLRWSQMSLVRELSPFYGPESTYVIKKIGSIAAHYLLDLPLEELAYSWKQTGHASYEKKKIVEISKS